MTELPPLDSILDRNWISLDQMTRLNGVTYQTGLRWIKTGKLKGVRIGGHWRIYEEEVKRFMLEGNAPKDPTMYRPENSVEEERLSDD